MPNRVNSASVSNNILNLIREYFSSSGFLFEKDSQVKSIDGREEALSAWIAANYLENNFHKVYFFPNIKHWLLFKMAFLIIYR